MRLEREAQAKVKSEGKMGEEDKFISKRLSGIENRNTSVRNGKHVSSGNCKKSM